MSACEPAKITYEQHIQRIVLRSANLMQKNNIGRLLSLLDRLEELRNASERVVRQRGLPTVRCDFRKIA